MTRKNKEVSACPRDEKKINSNDGVVQNLVKYEPPEISTEDKYCKILESIEMLRNEIKTK